MFVFFIYLCFRQSAFWREFNQTDEFAMNTPTVKKRKRLNLLVIRNVKRFCYCPLAGVLFLNSPTVTPQSGPSKAFDRAKTDRLLDAHFRDKQYGYSALITKDFNEIYSKVGGYANLELYKEHPRPPHLPGHFPPPKPPEKALSNPIRKESKFRIGSITKQFTAVAILKLQEDGFLDLSNKLADFFPGFQDYPEITIEHLLTHTSGIVDSIDDFYSSVVATIVAQNYQAKVAKAKNNSLPIPDQSSTIPNLLVEFFTETNFKNLLIYYSGLTGVNYPTKWKTGTGFDYSNFGYILLGLIIHKVTKEKEEITEKGFEPYIQKNLFDKAGMSHTTIDDENKIIENRADGYEKVSYGNPSFGLDNFKKSTPLLYMSASVFSAGNILSTTEDLNRWYKALFSHQIISKGLLKKAHTPHVFIDKEQKIGYGYGWIISSEGKGKTISHNGVINGFRANVIFHSSSKILSVLLSGFYYSLSDKIIENLSLEMYFQAQDAFLPSSSLKKKIKANLKEGLINNPMIKERPIINPTPTGLESIIRNQLR